jgi:hypothetical protein
MLTMWSKTLVLTLASVLAVNVSLATMVACAGATVPSSNPAAPRAIKLIFMAFMAFPSVRC